MTALSIKELTMRLLSRPAITMALSLASGLLVQAIWIRPEWSLFLPLVFLPLLLALAVSRPAVCFVHGAIFGAIFFSDSVSAFQAWESLAWAPWLIMSAAWAVTCFFASFLACRAPPAMAWVVVPAAIALFPCLSEYALHMPFALSAPIALGHASWARALTLFGAPGLDFVVLSLSSLWAHAMLGRLSWRNAAVISSICILAVVFPNWLFAARTTESLHIAAIQGNFSRSDFQAAKWSLYERTRIENRLDSLTARAIRERADVILWPEEGNDLFNGQSPRRLAKLRSLMSGSSADLLAGGKEVSQTGEVFNAVQYFTGEGLKSSARKAHTVPLAEANLGNGEPRIFETRHGKIGVAICFDSVFGGHMRSLARQGAGIIVAVTDDSSFGLSNMAQIHMALSLTRAMEVGLPIVFLSNGGPVAISDGRGRVTSFASTGPEGGIISMHVAKGRSAQLDLDLIHKLVITLLCGVICAAFPVSKKRQSSFSSMPLKWNHVATMLFVVALSPMIYITAFLGMSAHASAAVVDDFKWRRAKSEASDSFSLLFRQTSADSCGAASAAYLLTYWGEEIFEGDIARQRTVPAGGYSFADLLHVLSSNGYKAKAYRGEWSDLPRTFHSPVIAHVNGNHFVVLLNASHGIATYFDPKDGKINAVRERDFLKMWDGYFMRVVPSAMQVESGLRTTARYRNKSANITYLV